MTPNSILKTMKLIYGSIFLALLFVTIFFYLNHKKQEIIFDFQNQKFIISLFLTVSSIFFGNMLYKTFKSQIPANISLKEKIAKLQTAYLLRYAILEAPVFIIVFVLQDNKSYFILPLITLLYMLSLFPSKEKLINELNMNAEEIHKMNLDNEEI